MDSEPKDFKAVKVQMKSSQRSGEQLSRSMLYSGVNIFGQLSQIYIQSKESGQSYSEFAESIGKGSSQGSGDGGSVMKLGQEVLSIFKRLQKKDSTTKIKAFQELERYVDSLDSGHSMLDQSMQSEDITNLQTSSDEIQSLLTFFLYHFCRIIMNEPDKKVREAAHTTFAAFIKKAKRKLGPHLKRIFSLWYCSFFDVSQEVSFLAKRNFETAFPESKREQVFKIAYKNFLHFANEQLKQSEEQITESVADLSKAQREDVFDRITSSVLQALTKSFEFTKEWSEEEREHFKKKLIDILDLNAPMPSSGELAEEKKVGKKVQHSSYLWGFLQPKYRGRVRACCLQFISNLLMNLPKEVVESQISQLAPLIHGLVGEDNSQLQTTLWRDALFILGKNFPNSWESTNIKKNFLPKLYQALKASAFGSPTALYDNFVKFASIFPLYHLVDYTEDKVNKASLKERCNLIRETLTNIYLGLKNDESVAFHQDLTKSYFETFAFLVLKRVQPLILSDKASKEDKEFAISQLKKCMQLPLEDYISNFEKFTSKVQNQRNIRVTIPAQYGKFLKDLSDRNLDPLIFDALIEYMNESINLSIEKKNTIRIINGLLNTSINRDTPYYQKGLIQNLVMKLQSALLNKITQETEALGKESIESLNQKVFCLLRVIYKLSKYSVKCDSSILIQTSATLQNTFEQVLKKKELAKNVLSSENLTKLKAINENILRSIILVQNLLTDGSTADFPSFINRILTSKTLDSCLKLKVLLPSADFKKINFSNYYGFLNKPDIHSEIMNYILQDIVQDENEIHHTWAILDKSLSLLKQQGAHSFILPEDQIPIAEAVLAKITTLKPNDYNNLQHYFSSVKSLLIMSGEENYESLRQVLFDKLLLLNQSQPAFQPLWSIYSATLKTHITKDGQQRTNYFQYCITRLKEELININHQKAQYSKKGVVQFDAINRFTLIVKQFILLLPQQSKDRQNIIEEILLEEDTFTSNLSNNCLPLKMFRDLFLSGGLGGFDVTQLFQNSKYIWLAAVLLNARHLPSLANFIEMKRQLIIFVDTELIPTLINQALNGNTQLVIDVISYMSDKAKLSVDYVYSLENFLKKMIDPGEDFPPEEKPVLKIDDFKTIFRIVSKDVVSSILSKDSQIDYSQSVLLLLRILRQVAYYILDESIIIELFTSSVETLKSYVLQSDKVVNYTTSIALEIYQALNQYLGGAQQAVYDDLSKNLLVNMLQSQQGPQDADSNILNAVLNFAAHMLEVVGVSSFTNIVKGIVNFQQFLSWIIDVQRYEHLQPLTYIYLLSIIRKTINSTELITDRNLLVQQVIEIAKDKALAFDFKMNKMQELMKQSANIDTIHEESKKRVAFAGVDEDAEPQGEEDEDYQIEDFENEMLQEAAETLLAFTGFVQPSLDENDLFILLSSGVESLQKSAFVLLKQLYENFIPTLKFTIEDNEMLKQIQEEALDSVNQEAEIQTEEKKGGEHFHHHDHQKIKNKLAFRNISEILIETLENPPTVGQDGSIHQQHIISGSTHVESLIFQDTHNNPSLISNKVFGYFLSWNALLIKIENGRIKSQLQGQAEYAVVLGAINEYLEENDGIYRMLLVNLLAYLPEEKRGLQEAYNVSAFEPEYADYQQKKSTALLTVYTLLNFMKSFPSLARKYFQECDKQILDLVMPYIKQIVSPAILENEIKKIEVAQLSLGQKELTFSLFKSTKEILASFSKGEIEMTLKIRIPADYPLKLVEVDVSRQIKISEKQLRKWILAIRKIIQFQNGDIISAVLAWKANIEREIDGIEDCYICYCVVHETDQSLPKMPCKTCKNKFHVACIRKWFRQSHKSNCPICQNYFF